MSGVRLTVTRLFFICMHVHSRFYFLIYYLSVVASDSATTIHVYRYACTYGHVDIYACCRRCKLPDALPIKRRNVADGINSEKLTRSSFSTIDR